MLKCDILRCIFRAAPWSKTQRKISHLSITFDRYASSIGTVMRYILVIRLQLKLRLWLGLELM